MGEKRRKNGTGTESKYEQSSHKRQLIIRNRCRKSAVSPKNSISYILFPRPQRFLRMDPIVLAKILHASIRISLAPPDHWPKSSVNVGFGCFCQSKPTSVVVMNRNLRFGPLARASFAPSSPDTEFDDTCSQRQGIRPRLLDGLGGRHDPRISKQEERRIQSRDGRRTTKLFCRNYSCQTDAHAQLRR